MQRHNTPLSLCAVSWAPQTPQTGYRNPSAHENIQLATPPQIRRRVDTYRESMDPKVEEDTAPVHCSLDMGQTISFLDIFFSDGTVFNNHENSNTNSIKSALHTLENRGLRRKGRWTNCPKPSKATAYSEESIASFFNGIINEVQGVHCTRRWTAKAAQTPMVGLSGVIRKPDLLLCDQEVIQKRVDDNKFDIRTDVYVMGEVKKTHSDESKKASYVELAGKAAFTLEAQDGRYAMPGIRILGTHIILTLFDRGGSISTHPLDLHTYPEQFLRILLGVTFADGIILGFDHTVSPVINGQKAIQIVKQGKCYVISVTQLLFISGSLHGRGTTVWSGTVTIDHGEEEVVVKDSWVDPLRKFTEGRILKILESANVKGVPRLVHEQQAETLHPVTKKVLNHSTHILRSLISRAGLPYYLRAMSRLVSKPRGSPIFEFSSLAELLVGLIDCLSVHRDALRRAGILHRDISLFNLLLVAAAKSELGVDFLERVLQEPDRTQIHEKIKALPRRGLLGDWGYAVPTGDANSPSVDPPTPATALQICVRRQNASLLVSRAELLDTDEVVIPVADKPFDHEFDTSFDASPLHRTGTWAWMAAELSYLGPGVPVEHRAHHDIESFFYILLAVCLLYDKPEVPKSAAVLSHCFDPFFAVTQPSTHKTVTIQSDFGWTVYILPNISQYFQPIVPLLNEIRKELILPIILENGALKMNHDFAHDQFIDAITKTLAQLGEEYWVVPVKEVKSDGDISTQISSNAASLPGPSTNNPLPSAVLLSQDSLPRLPSIRLSATSSGSRSKRRLENESESGSRTAKRRAQDTHGPTDQGQANSSGLGSLTVPGPHTLLSQKLRQATSAPL